MTTEPRRQSSSRGDDISSSPIVWFALLERARITSDLALARRARRELARQGVRVVYRQRCQPHSPLPLREAELEQIAHRVAELLRRVASRADGGRGRRS